MKSLQNYLKNSVREFNNVTWPTRNQAIRICIIVLIFIIVSAVVLGFVDYLLSIGYESLLNLSI